MSNAITVGSATIRLADMVIGQVVDQNQVPLVFQYYPLTKNGPDQNRQNAVSTPHRAATGAYCHNNSFPTAWRILASAVARLPMAL